MNYNDIPTNTIGIYKINFPNKKIYIGRAINIKRRIYEHYMKNDNTSCYKALHKYYNSFYDIDIDILESLEEYDFDLICALEKKWIAYFDSYNNKEIGYNNSPGGDGGANGVNNNASKITEEELEDIISMLKENKTNVEIGKKYNLHPDTIGKINQGKTYFNENLAYPIRNCTKRYYGSENKIAYDDSIYEEIVKLLKDTKISEKEISEKIGCSQSTVFNINIGKHFYTKNLKENFPLRNNGRRTTKFTEEEIISIKKDLLNPELSIIDISNKYNCSRDTIGDINQGKRYTVDGEHYPIRTFYPKRKRVSK